MIKNIFLFVFLIMPAMVLANTDAIVPSIESLIATSKNDTTQSPLTFKTSSSIVFDEENIRWLLNKDGYSLNDLDNIEDSSSQQRGFTSIVVKSPISISTGCGTVEANLDEGLAIMLAAFKQQLKKLPSYYMQEVLGLPDINNPKAVFEYVYDTTTTLICGGEAGTVQAMESGSWASMAYLKNKFDMTADSSKETGLGTQVGHGCPTGATPDVTSELTKTGTDKNVAKQTEGDVAKKAAKGHNSKFNRCKQKYEEYKTFIEAKIKKFDIYKKRAKELNNSSCKVLANKSGVSEDFDMPNPFAKIDKGDSSEILSAKSIISTQNINYSDDGLKSEIVVNIEAIADEINLDGSLKPYRDSNLKMSGNVFRLGRNYLNTVTECLNQHTNDKYSVICEKIDKLTSPFPVRLFNDDRSGFVPLVETKKLLCDTTLFNVDDDQFIIDSIGYVTHLLGIESGSSSTPAVADLRAATEVMVLGDFCASKYREEVRGLSIRVENKIREKWLEVEDELRGAIVKQDAWKVHEVYVLPSATYEDKSVVKVCQKSNKQKEYYAALAPKTLTVKDDSIVTIKKIPSTSLQELSKVIGSEVDAFLPESFETQMLCKPDTGIGISKEQDTCKVENIVCGINYAKFTKRTDNLYENQVDSTKPSAIDNYKKSLKGTPFTIRSHQKKINDQLVSKIDKLIKMLTIKERMDKQILNSVSIELLKKITNLGY